MSEKVVRREVTKAGTPAEKNDRFEEFVDAGKTPLEEVKDAKRGAQGKSDSTVK